MESSIDELELKHVSRMTKEDREDVRYRIEEEGLHYTFEDYSDFTEVDDPIFHSLRKKYLKAADELINYIG